MTLGYGYDRTHRRTSETSSNPAYVFTPVTGSVSYGAASRINTYPTVGAATLTYDKNHNLTFDGASTLGYDVENRLVSASNTGGASAYLYDALGHRKQSGVAGQTTTFFEDSDREIAEFTGSWGNLIEYVRGPGDETIASLSYQVQAFDPTYYHNDPLGSPLAVTHAGAVTNTLVYGPYGEITTLAGPALRYTGHRLDAETGLYYARARHYSPTLGRFLQFDPVGINGGTNLYAYTANDPLNATDPSGLLANQVANGVYGLLKGTARATADLVTTPGHYFGTTLPNATGQLLDACGTVCDPGALASVGPLGVGAGDAIMGLRMLAGAGQVAETTTAVSRAAGIAGQLEELRGGVPRFVPTPKGASQFIFPNGGVMRFDIQPGQYLRGQDPHIRPCGRISPASARTQN